MELGLELKNDLDKPITFTGNQTSCGACLSVKSMPKKIAPGESGVFELEFNAIGKRGVISQNAAFWEGEPKSVLVVVDLTAIVQSIWCKPNTIALGNRVTSVPYQTKLYVMASAFPDAKVVSVQTNSPWISLSSKPINTSDHLKKQHVEVINYIEINWQGTDVMPGKLFAEIVVKVQTGQKEKAITVPVSGYLTGDVDIVPAQILFGRITAEEIVRTCQLTFHKGNVDPGKITLTALHSNIKMKLEKLNDDPDKFLLTVRWLPTDKITDKLIEGTILGCDSTGKMIMSIPYIAY